MFEIAPQPRGQPLLVALGQFERGAAGPALAAAVLVVFAAEPAEHFARGNAAFELQNNIFYRNRYSKQSIISKSIRR